MKSKIGTGIFALLFAIGFGAGGFFGVSSLARQLNGWWQARDWHAVPATVLEANLVSSHDETTTYRATARYRYELRGRSYEGSRIGFTSGSDNVGSWQQDRYRELSAARRAGIPIRVWVNPSEPTQSIVDRNLRWAMVAFSVPFATLFPAIAVGALWFFVHTLRTPPATPQRNPRRIASDGRQRVLVLWCVASFWGLIAFPIAFIAIPQQFGRSWAWLFTLLFPLAGIVLLWVAARQTLRLLRNGTVTIELSPAQPCVGELITVQASFDRAPPIGTYRCSLSCEEVDSRGDDTSTATKWQQECDVDVRRSSATVTFSPPSDLPPSEPEARVYHRWRVRLTFPDGKDERGFDVIIGEAPERRAQVVAA